VDHADALAREARSSVGAASTCRADRTSAMRKSSKWRQR
jgi:hypothetical protein